jgi:ubiquinone/menaquinone biosynthesis C-methylase UbiE
MSRLHFFDKNLLASQAIVQIDNYKRVTARPNGWHYDLDMAWILRNFETANIRPGATILDAGAGFGIFQFLLAGLGYHVISLDFSERIMPASFVKLFNISGDGMIFTASEYDHQYMQLIDYGNASPHSSITTFFRRLYNIVERHDSLEDRLSLGKRALFARLNLLFSSFIRFKTTRLDQKQFEGSIHLVRAPFHECIIEPLSVDAVVSISAIEHSDIELISDAIAMFRRVAKPGGKIFLTTSMATDGKRAFDHEVHGFNYATSDLQTLFGVCDYELPSQSRLEAYESDLLGMEKLWSRLDRYYRLDPNSHFYRGKFQRLPYLPVGLELA